MVADRLFGEGAPRIRSIPPGAAFLKELARSLAAELDLSANPGELAEAIIYVPNRRSARALMLALFDASGGAALLPPDIRAMGDTGSGDPPPIAELALAGAATPLSKAQRIGAMAALVRRYFLTELDMELPPAPALASARDLSHLLEQAAMSERADWSKLEGIAPDNVAQHWARSVGFLEIVTQFWPEWLEEQGTRDPYAEPVRAATAMAAHWQASPPAGPVIIAGSTGATPDGRILMRAVLGLSKGLVVLPGLDTALNRNQWDQVAGSPGHPQSTLIRTLRALDLTPADVAGWPDVHPGGPARARIRLIQEALAPADATADWRETLQGLSSASGQALEDFVADGLSGLRVIETPDEAGEAMAAALLLRETLATAGKTAALVTPDAGLARRVCALLGRWGVDVPPSAPVPLGRTQAGSLTGLCARWAADPGDPAILAAVVKHPFVAAHLDARMLDLHFLRGPRRWRSLEDLARRIESLKPKEAYADYTPADQVDCALQVRRLKALMDLADADFSSGQPVDAAFAAERVADLAGQISRTPMPWAGEDGAGASRLLQHLAELGPFLGPMTPQAFADLVDAEAANQSVQGGQPDHPRLSIWGPLEARLQSADRLILAGLNEDVWPQRPAPDAFLPGRFRGALGLNDPEERMGLSAHDFAQLASAPDVYMLHAARRDDSPAVASRWVWRLRTLATAAFAERTAHVMQGDAGALMGWVQALHGQGIGTLPQDFSAEPRPRRRTPEHWPVRLSVTRVDRLQRDPYSLWAGSVLGLSEVDVINAPLAANLRGTAVHLALEQFEDLAAEDQTAEGLLGLIRALLADEGEPEAAWFGRQAIWEQVVEWYLGWRAQRDIAGKLLKEVEGAAVFEIAGHPFHLSAEADRIEQTSSGGAVIVDYKTGAPPSDRAIASGFDQQMPLQAIIALRGGFRDLPATPVEALEYVSVRGRPSARRIGDGPRSPKPVGDLIAEAEAGLVKLIAAYRHKEAVFASAPRVQFVKYDYGYNLLARRAEWNRDASSGEGGDE